VLEQRLERDRVRRDEPGDPQRSEVAARAEEHQRERRRGPDEQALIGRSPELIDLTDERERGEGIAVEDREQDLTRPAALAAYGGEGPRGEARPDQEIERELEPAGDRVPVARDHRDDAERDRAAPEDCERIEHERLALRMLERLDARARRLVDQPRLDPLLELSIDAHVCAAHCTRGRATKARISRRVPSPLRSRGT
jgi:hypothetical protein